MRFIPGLLAAAAVLLLGGISNVQAAGWSGHWGSYVGVPVHHWQGNPIDPHVLHCERVIGCYHCCPVLYSPYHPREPMPPGMAKIRVINQLTALGIPLETADEKAPKPKPDQDPKDKKPKPGID